MTKISQRLQAYIEGRILEAKELQKKCIVDTDKAYFQGVENTAQDILFRLQGKVITK